MNHCTATDVDPATCAPDRVWASPAEQRRAQDGRCGLARWLAMLLVLLIWLMALWRVLGEPSPRLPLLFNWSDSLPYKVAVLDAHPAAFKRGDYIVYAFEGQASAHYPGLRGQPLFKRIVGVAGDRVSVQGRRVLVNGVPVGRAKLRTFDGLALEPLAPVVIAVDHFYVQGTSPDSFDSRYSISGLVARRQVLGRVRPLF